MNFKPPRSLGLPALILFLGSGCGLKPSENAPPETRAARAPAQAAAVSAETTYFDPIASQLDPGGSVYLILNASQWTENLADRIGSWREAVLSLPAVKNKTAASNAFNFVTGLVKKSGLESVAGFGFSGIAIEKGFYQTKCVVERAPNAPPGALWTLFGAGGNSMELVNWLPADTVLASVAGLDLKSVWNLLNQQAESSGFAAAKQALNHLNQAVEKGTGKDLESVLNSLAGECGLFITFNPTNVIRFPMPGGRVAELPEPGLVAIIRVKNDTLFNLIDAKLQNLPQLIRNDAGGLRMRTFAAPLPLPMVLRPTVAAETNYLYFASNDDLLKQMFAVRSGKAPGLKSTAEFEKLARGLPAGGSAFSFVSRRFGQAFMTMQTSMLTNQSPNAAALVEKISAINQPFSAFAVGQLTPQGWRMTGHGTRQPANLAALPLVVPVAVAAGMIVPALQKARGKAQSVVCLNNLKQLGLAARLYANDHNGKYPADFASMKEYLGTPGALFCPADPKKPALDKLNWESVDFSKSSYEFVARNLTESSPNLAEQVLFRCRIHGSECFGDGHVAPKNQ